MLLLNEVYDEVENGDWDPGNYLERRQSERLYKITLPELRPNWLLEEEIDIRELQNRVINPPMEGDPNEN